MSLLLYTGHQWKEHTRRPFLPTVPFCLRSCVGIETIHDTPSRALAALCGMLHRLSMFQPTISHPQSRSRLYSSRSRIIQDRDAPPRICTSPCTSDEKSMADVSHGQCMTDNAVFVPRCMRSLHAPCDAMYGSCRGGVRSARSWAMSVRRAQDKSISWSGESRVSGWSPARANLRTYGGTGRDLRLYHHHHHHHLTFAPVVSRAEKF